MSPRSWQCHKALHLPAACASRNKRCMFKLLVRKGFSQVCAAVGVHAQDADLYSIALE